MAEPARVQMSVSVHLGIMAHVVKSVSGAVSRSHLNGHTLEFHSHSQKLELSCTA